jgi:hypothetical protein
MRLSLRGNGVRKTLFWDIPRVAGVALLVKIGTNLTIAGLCK